MLESILSLILMWVILSVSTGATEKGITAGIAIGAVIALEAMFAGPITGASMNPARSLGPALVSMRFENLWIYLTAPPIGASSPLFSAERCVTATAVLFPFNAIRTPAMQRPRRHEQSECSFHLHPQQRA